jgi:hypothetical protein
MMNRPQLYLAGKIDKDDWRHRLVPGLRRHEGCIEPIETQDFVYVGPFFKSCDHGCFHADSAHGLLGQFQKLRRLPQLHVRNTCFEGVSNCDIFILYMNHREAYGSLVELGWAQALGKKTVVMFAPGIAYLYNNDFWFGAITADRVVFDVDENDVKRIIYEVVGDCNLANASGCGE